MQGSKEIDATFASGFINKYSPVVVYGTSKQQQQQNHTVSDDDDETMYQQEDQYQIDNESNNNFNDEFEDDDDDYNNTAGGGRYKNDVSSGGAGPQINSRNIKQEMFEIGSMGSSSYGGNNGLMSSSYVTDENYNLSLKPGLSLQQQQQQMLANAARSSKGELTCVVCGAPANGYNFDAITCESCKAFFRRNAFKPLNQFRCTNPNSNNSPCIITIVTRKKCKKCRIIKCFNMGMRKDWIMTDHEREEKKRKIEENRRRKGGPGGGMGNDDNSNLSSSELANLNGSFYDEMNGGGESCGPGSPISGSNGGAKPIRRRRRRRRHSLLESNGFPTPSNGSGGSNKPVNLVNDPLRSLNQSGPASTTTITGKKMKSLSSNNSELHGVYSSSLNDLHNDSFNNHLIANGNSNNNNNNNNSNSSGASSSCDSSPNKSSNLSSMSNGPASVTNLIANFGHSNCIFKQMNECSVRLLGETAKAKSKMTDLQKSQINAIKEAYKQAIRLVKAQGTPRHPDDINTTINVTELAVRRIIFYFKLISDFRNLDHDLMVKLLKHNMMSLLQVHGVNSYDRVNKTFQEPGTDDTPFAADSLRDVYGAQIYELIMTINENLHATSNGDMTHVKLIMLIVVFDPSNPNLSESERSRVSELLDKYVGLLHAYMNDKFGTERTQYLFKEILFEVNRIGDLAAWFERTVAENSNYDYIRPLMKEVFSFSSTCGSTANSYQNSAENTPPSSINSNASSVMSTQHHSVHSQQHNLSETYNNQ